VTNFIRHFFGSGAGRLRRKIAALYIILIGANLGAWAWALIGFRDHPVLLGTALLAYGFGLRHAVDADHIAAIDNVTRKLMHRGDRPVTIGLFFALGHSTVVILASLAVTLTATALNDRFAVFRGIGTVVGTSVSALFLLIIAAMNLLILGGVYRAFRRVRAGGAYVEEELDMLTGRGGFMARLFRPLFALITSSWMMLPLGFLFGLGFDTATEVALLTLSAKGAAQGLPIATILVLPALFTAGMTLIDTSDGVLMLGAYGWAFLKPIRKIYYNMTITLVSVLVALLVGSLETLGLIGDQLSLSGPFWQAIGGLNDNFGSLGYVIIGVFVTIWLGSAVIYRLKGYDSLELEQAGD
jgi:nickel/cobalt transporter (NiCoT) family protein